MDVASALVALSRLSASEGLSVMWPLVTFIVVLLAYFVIIFSLYEKLAKRDPFTIIEHPGEPLEHIGFMLEYIFLFPAITFLWIVLLTITVAIPAQSNVGWFLYQISIEHILLAVTATTVAVRMTAYFNEKMSKELARLIPLNFLTVVLIELPGVPLDAPFTVVSSLPPLVPIFAYYFVFVMIIEFLLKLYGHFTVERRVEAEEDKILTKELDNIKMIISDKNDSPEAAIQNINKIAEISEKKKEQEKKPPPDDE